MDWLDRLRTSLFGESVQRSGHLHHGPLERSAAFLERYEQWSESDERSRVLAHFRQLLSQEQRHSDTAMHLFLTPQATGMQIARPVDASPEVLHFLQEEFKDRLIAEGYRVNLADHKIDPMGEHRERYSLKPNISAAAAPPLPQLFGNVAIETWGNNLGKAERLKVLITVYSDRLYSPAESGIALINSLLAGRGRALS